MPMLSNDLKWPQWNGHLTPKGIGTHRIRTPVLESPIFKGLDGGAGWIKDFKSMCPGDSIYLALVTPHEGRLWDLSGPVFPNNQKLSSLQSWVIDTMYASVTARSLPPSYQSFPHSWGSLPSPRPTYHSCVWGNRHVTVTYPGFILIWLFIFFPLYLFDLWFGNWWSLGTFLLLKFLGMHPRSWCMPGNLGILFFYFNITLFSCPSYTRFQNWIFMTVYNFLEINIIEFLLILF